MSKILIVGKNSLIGSHLNFENHDVFYISRQDNSDPKSIFLDIEFSEKYNIKSYLEMEFDYCVFLADLNLVDVFFQIGFNFKKIICTSTTSVITKRRFDSDADRKLVSEIESGEKKVNSYCSSSDVSFVILRPTLIFDFLKDKNISRMYTFIKKYKILCVFGRFDGKRQPILALDIATFFESIVDNKYILPNCAVNIAGSEVLNYYEIFDRLELEYFKIKLPLFVLKVLNVISLDKLRTVVDFYSHSEYDFIFSNDKAEEYLAYAPKKFRK